MAPHPTPDLSAIAAGDRVAIRQNHGDTWARHHTWTTATVERVTPARITADGRTYRRSDGMRLGDGGTYEADYLFPHDHPTAVAARHLAGMDAARRAIARACDAASTAARGKEPTRAIREHLDAAQTELDRLEQLQTQGAHQ